VLASHALNALARIRSMARDHPREKLVVVVGGSLRDARGASGRFASSWTSGRLVVAAMRTKSASIRRTSAKLSSEALS
jgi:hypothetical protein